MSLIAGASGGWEPSFEPAFREHLRTFPIIRGEIPDDYDLDVVGYGAQRLQDKAGQVIGTKLKKTSMDTITRVEAGGMHVYCLGCNEFLRDAADSPELADMPGDELLTRIREADGEYVAVAVPDPVRAFTNLRTSSAAAKSTDSDSPGTDSQDSNSPGNDSPGSDTAGDLHIICDRFGSRSCFFSLSDVRFQFSTNIAFLTEMIPGGVTLDPERLLQLLTIGNTLDCKTTFREIERVRAAEHLVVRNGRIHKRHTYYKPGSRPTPVTDYKAYAEEAYAEMAASVGKRSRDRTGFVSLSGGLDSRLVASASDPDRFTAFTFINSLRERDTTEVRVAGEVARRLNLRHTVCPLSETALISDVIGDVLRLAGGQTMVHHPVKTMSFIRHMQEHGFHMGGGMGGVISGGAISGDLISPGRMHQSDDMIGRYIDKRINYPDEFLRKIFRNDVIENLLESHELFSARDGHGVAKEGSEIANNQQGTASDESGLAKDGFNGTADGPSDLLRRTLRTRLDHFHADDPARKITFWSVMERQQAFTFNSPIHTHPDVTESSPLLGYRYTEMMLNLTSAELIRKNFYYFMIYHCLADLRAVPYANSGQTLDCELIVRHYPMKRLSHYAGMLTKARRKLARRLQKNKKTKPNFHYEMVLSDKKALARTREILGESAVLQALFNVEACLAFIRQFEEGKIVFSPGIDANFVSFLITVTHQLDVFPIRSGS